MSPLVTVFLPTFQRLRQGYLSRSIESILSQSFSNFELLVIDDGSLDGSAELIAKYSAQDKRVKHVRFEKNVGMPALTTCIAFHNHSKGKYLTWCFDDAMLYREHISTLLGAFENGRNSEGMVYGKGKARLPDGSMPIFGHQLEPQALLAGHNHIPNTVVMLRREVVEKVGWYDPHIILKRYCDWDLWCRIYKAGIGIRFLDVVLAEEDGPSLSDSLGNSHSAFPDLVKKYSELNRNDLLVGSLEKYDVFRCDQLNLSDKEKDQLGMLIQEHFFNICDFKGLTSACHSPEDLEKIGLLATKLSIQNDLEAGTVTRWIAATLNFVKKRDEKHRKEVVSLQKILTEKQTFIDMQRVAIDEKQAFIDLQRAAIDEKQAYIDSNLSRAQESKVF